jgi:uncharacterized membrane protein
MAVQQQIQPSYTQYTGRRSKLSTLGYRIGEFIYEYWATMLTVALGLLVLAAISVPFLSYLGLDWLSKQIFYALHTVCAQIPAHSFYVFGHQLGMCARNLSIYSSMFVGCLIFVLSGKHMKGIPWWFWLLLILPMAIDGTTQMFGWRESTWELRVITGVLFGLGNVWFALPLVQKTLLETPMQPRISIPLPPQQADTSTETA